MLPSVWVQKQKLGYVLVLDNAARLLLQHQNGTSPILGWPAIFAYIQRRPSACARKATRALLLYSASPLVPAVRQYPAGKVFPRNENGGGGGGEGGGGDMLHDVPLHPELHAQYQPFE
jgi:hypothetical protein